MKIGILGAGNVGGTLGTRFAQDRHQVVFSSRTPQSGAMQELLAKAGATARAATVEETVATSDVVVLATPWAATKDVLAAAGSLAGKVLIDVINPLKPDLSGLTLARPLRPPNRSRSGRREQKS